mgnify:CR=1 FL=1
MKMAKANVTSVKSRVNDLTLLIPLAKETSTNTSRVYEETAKSFNAIKSSLLHAESIQNELKVTKTNKITISPHQIAFHLIHPHNTFILVKALLSKEVKLYEGSRIQDLVACGLKLEPCSLGLESSLKKLASL